MGPTGRRSQPGVPGAAGADAARARSALEIAFASMLAAASAIPAMVTHPILNFDSPSYLGPLSLTAERLPVVPLIYLALTHNLRAIVVFQAAFGVACWVYLAFVALRSYARPWSYVAFVGILVLSSSDYVTHWYAAILSDSLSLSLLALLLASVSSWRASQASPVRVLIVAMLWALTRDTNGYLLLIAGVVGLALVGWRRRDRSLAAASAVAVVGGLAAIASATVGGLWKQPFLHVVSERVLVSPAKIRWFASHGMPLTPALQQLAGSYTNQHADAFSRSPVLASFRRWMDANGERTYLEYVVLHPWWWLRGTFGRHEELTAWMLPYYGGVVHQHVVPAFVRNLFLTFRQTTLITAAGVAGAVLVVKRGALGVLRGDAAIWASLAALGMIGLVLAWVGDTWEIGRHSVGPTVQVAICLLLLVSAALSAPRPEDAIDVSEVAN